MKQYAYIFAGLIALMILFIVGCSEPIGTTANGGKIYAPESDMVGHLFRTKFDGHLYIIRNNANKGGICHDPDCPCSKKVVLEKP